jgi:RNA polymerase sigma-70 factor (ECF subfamily)
MLRRLAGDGADDLAQETFLAAWRSAASWRGEGSYFAWLSRIAWRQFLSKRRNERPTQPLDDAEHLATQPDAPRRSAIDQAMGRLSDRERMAALLCFAQGRAHPEAAQIMDIPLGTLKSLVARAREKLIHCLEDEQ